MKIVKVTAGEKLEAGDLVQIRDGVATKIDVRASSATLNVNERLSINLDEKDWNGASVSIVTPS